MKNKSNIFITTFIIVNMLYIMIINSLCFTKVIDYLFLGNTYVYTSIISFIVYIAIIIYKRYIKKEYKYNIYDVLTVLLVTFALISVIYSLRPNISLNGFYDYQEGLFALLYYYSLFNISRFIEGKSKKIISYLIILFGIYEGTYCLLQRMNSPLVTIYRNHEYYKVYNGTLNNPNLYGTFMLLSLGHAIGHFIDSKKKITSLFFFIISLYLFFTMLIGNTMSVIVGLIAILFMLLIWAIKYKKKFKYLLLIIAFPIILIYTSNIKYTSLYEDMKQTGNEINQISKGTLDDSFGTGRMKIWKRYVPLIPEYMLTGAGIDCFLYAAKDEPVVTVIYVTVKAHNEYLQIIITEGVFALITYLVLYFTVFVRYYQNEKEVYLILPVIGYLVQAFFNISVIHVAPFFFISLGLAAKKEKVSIYKAYIKKLLPSKKRIKT